jgi:hypothetical protein
LESGCQGGLDRQRARKVAISASAAVGASSSARLTCSSAGGSSGAAAAYVNRQRQPLEPHLDLEEQGKVLAGKIAAAEMVALGREALVAEASPSVEACADKQARSQSSF